MTRIDPRVQLQIEKLAPLANMRLRAPDGEPPAIDDAARVWTLNVDAQLSNGWRWPNEIAWHRVAAWRAEDAHGAELRDVNDDQSELEMDGDFLEHAEPSSEVEE